MTAPQPFQPDAAYCVYCHAQASGSCASCRALVCADCADLVTAAGRSYAVCRECRGRTSLARGWLSLLWPVLALAAAGLLVLWWLRG